MSRRFWIAALTLSAVFAAESLLAQEMSPRSWGVRGGFRLGERDFDQLVLGAQADLGDVATNLRFAPNIQLGIGSDVTILSLDPELQYVFRDNPMREDTNFYAGGGLGVHILNFEANDEDRTHDSDTQLKINVSAGIEKEISPTSAFFGEIRVSFIDGTWVDFLGGLNLLR